MFAFYAIIQLPRLCCLQGLHLIPNSPSSIISSNGLDSRNEKNLHTFSAAATTIET